MITKQCRVRWIHTSSGDRLKANEVEAMIGRNLYRRLRAGACLQGRSTLKGLGVTAVRTGRK